MVTRPTVFAALCFTVSIFGTALSENRFPTGTLVLDEKVKPAVSLHRIARRQTPEKALPVRVKNITHLPVVSRQSLANCGAFAPSYYYKTWQEAKERGWVRPDPSTHPERVMSPGFTFPLSNLGINDGAYVEVAMQVICDAGIPPLSVLPETWDFSSYPPESAWRAALPYRGGTVGAIDFSTTDGMEALKEHLASGDLAIYTPQIYYDTYEEYPHAAGTSNGVMVEEGTIHWDPHAFTLIGYDDEKSYILNGRETRGAFLAVNSWGSSWGVYDEDAESGGFIWFSYDYVRNNSALALTMTDRIGYEPKQLAVMQAYFQWRNRVGFSAYPGSPTRPLAPGFGPSRFVSGRFPFLGTLVFDATDYADIGSGLSFTLGVFEDSALLGSVEPGTEVGRVMAFHVETPDGRKVAASLPAEGVAIRSGEHLRVHAGPFGPTTLGEAFDDLAAESVRMAWCDWNCDGIPDLAVVGGFLNASRMTRLYRGLPTEELQLVRAPFELPGVAQGQLAWADFDVDGLPDLVIAGANEAQEPQLRVFRNVATISFEDWGGTGLIPLREPRLAVGDYNNDGRPDLVVSGFDSGGESRTTLYRNDINLGLVPSGIVLPGAAQQAVSWADMDGDGWLDLALGSILLRNTGGGFVESAALNPGLQSEHAWGDFNKDGKPDLAYSLLDRNGEQREDWVRTILYRNDGGFRFSPLDAEFTGVHSGTLSWGDFDNDGLLDLVVAGNSTDWIEEKATRLYRQKTPGVFEEVAPDLPNLGDGTASWVHLNGDTILDLVVSGTKPFDGTPPMKATTAAYISRMGTPGFPAPENFAPAAPDQLRVDQNPGVQGVRLRWGEGLDVETPAAGLRYQLRIESIRSTRPAIADNPLPVTGNSFPQMRLPGGGPGRLLTGLAPGIYHWKARSVDTSDSVSEWSDRQTFTIGPNGIVHGDANDDGILDAADAVSIYRMADGERPARPELADLDADGRVTRLDNIAIVSRLTGRTGGSRTTAVTKTIGPEGGTLSAHDYGVDLHIPSGAFPVLATVGIEVGTDSNDYGPSVLPLSWKITGLPWNFQQPLTLGLRDLRTAPEGEPYVATGSFGYATSDAGERWAYAKKRLETRSDDWYQTTIIPPDATISPMRKQSQATYGFTIQIYMLGATQYQYAGGNFTITGGREVRAKLPDVAHYLEDALAIFTNELGFQVNKRDWAAYPVEVCITDLGAGGDGTPKEAYAYPGWGYNSMGIQLSPYLLLNRDDDYIRRTVAHELFHLMQFFYDPRNALSRRGKPPHLWWNEATATYAESLMLSDPSYVPAPLQNNFPSTFLGMEQQTSLANDSDGLVEAAYGYAMANFARHFVQRNGGPASLRATYERIAKGEGALLSIHRSDTAYPNSGIFATFFEELTVEDLFPLPGQTRTLKRYVAKSPRDLLLTNPAVHRSVRFPKVKLPFLGANYGFLSFEAPFLSVEPGDKMGFQLTSDHQNTSMLTVIGYTPTTGAYEILGYAAPHSASGSRRLILENAPAFVRKDRWLIPVVTGHSPAALGTPPQSSQVAFGVFRDYSRHPIDQHKAFNGRLFYEDTRLNWPVFLCQGQLTANGVSRLTEHYKDNPSSETAVNGLAIQFWADPVEPVSLSYSAQLVPFSLTSSVYDSSREETMQVLHSMVEGSNLRYRLSKHRLGMNPDLLFEQEHLWTTEWQPTAQFELGYETEDMGSTVMYLLGVQYDYRRTVRSSTGEIVSQGEYTGSIDTWFTYMVVH